jgi:hypothetical protein
MRILAVAAVDLMFVARPRRKRFCEEETPTGEIVCAAIDPPLPERTELIAERLAHYARIGANHRLSGLGERLLDLA